jgi:hypothetical protein
LDKKTISKIALYYTLILIILSLVPVPDLGVPKFKLFELDKLVHLCMYTIFTIIWGLKTDSKIKILIFSILFGLGLETLQHLLPFGRYFDWGDFIANSSGVLFGIIILFYLKKKLL